MTNTSKPVQGRNPVLARHPLSNGGATLAILDANALLPPRLSDMLFDLHLAGLFSPRWTEKIEAEFIRNFGPVVFGKNKAERRAFASKTPDPRHVRAAQRRLECFRSAVGPEYELLLYDQPSYIARVPPTVDSGDVHIVSAALVALDYAQEFEQDDKVFIVSSNLKHLAVNDLKALGITVVSPGTFIDLLYAAEPGRVEQALLKSISDLSSPAITKEHLLTFLRCHKAMKAAAGFSKRWQSAILISTD
jgi:hypothetical protein